MAEATLRSWPKYVRGLKLGQRRICRASDTRTLIVCPYSGFAGGDTLATLQIAEGEIERTLLAGTLLSSLCSDSIARLKVAGTHLDWFQLEQLPLPLGESEIVKTKVGQRLIINASRLTFLHRRFAPEWVKLAHLYPKVFAFDPLSPTTDHQKPNTEWKHWWAVTEANRLRLRVEIDALCADLYGLDPDDFDWIVRDDPTDPKGFYRVDRKLPFRERLTGLSAAAFRSLKEGKWSAESAAWLSNDEFFDLLGIPELTNAQAAHAKGSPGPLIAKRDGCHVWKPENFPEDDPRYGWTWDDCWNDAIALLGSEEAVHAYVESIGTPASTDSALEEESFRLQTKKRSTQGRLF